MRMVSNHTPLSRNIVNKQHTRLAEREPVILFDVPTQGKDLEGWPAFCGKYGREKKKKWIPFVSRHRQATVSFALMPGLFLFVCVCVCLLLLDATRTLRT